jgi:hypothetical protein
MTNPADLAAADQELAKITERLDLLIAVWQKVQPECDAAGLDRLDRLAVFHAHRRGCGVQREGCVCGVGCGDRKACQPMIPDTPAARIRRAKDFNQEGDYPHAQAEALIAIADMLHDALNPPPPPRPERTAGYRGGGPNG